MQHDGAHFFPSNDACAADVPTEYPRPRNQGINYFRAQAEADKRSFKPSCLFFEVELDPGEAGRLQSKVR